MTQEAKEGGGNACHFHGSDRPTEVVRSHSYGGGGGYAKLSDCIAVPILPDAEGTEEKKGAPIA